MEKLDQWQGNKVLQWWEGRDTVIYWKETYTIDLEHIDKNLWVVASVIKCD